MKKPNGVVLTDTLASQGLELAMRAELDAAHVKACIFHRLLSYDAQGRQGLEMGPNGQSLARHDAQLHQLPPVDLREENLASLKSMHCEYRPYKKFRKLKAFCKVLVLLYVFYWMSVGQPDLIFKGLYQGFVHGFDSQCSNWYSCPEKTPGQGK